MGEALTCTESEELLALAGLGVLLRKEQAPLDQHLGGCAQCRSAAARYQQAVALLPNGLEMMEPPAAVRRSLMQAVYVEARPDPAPNRRRSARWLSPSRRRVFSLAGAATALAALAVVLAVALHPAASADHTYTVFGTTSDPAVRGTLTYYSGSHQAVMSVSGLPSLVSVAGAPPQVYEVWLVRAGGAALGVAFLEQSPATTSWSAVIHADLAQVVAVAATAEPAGGSLQPTGPQLLTVQVSRS